MSRQPRSSQTVLRRRHRAEHLFFWVRLVEGLFEALASSVFIAENALEFTHLSLQSLVVRCRHNLFAGNRSCQRALCRDPAPCEELVWAMPCWRATRLTVTPGA